MGILSSIQQTFTTLPKFFGMGQRAYSVYNDMPSEKLLHKKEELDSIVAILQHQYEMAEDAEKPMLKEKLDSALKEQDVIITKLEAINKAKSSTRSKDQDKSNSDFKDEINKSSMLDNILSKAKKVKSFLDDSSKKVKGDGFLDYMTSYFGAKAGSKMMDKFIDLMAKEYSLVNEDETGYKITINDILDKVLDVMGDPNHKGNDKNNTKDKITEITKLIDKTKKEASNLSPIFSLGLKLLTMVISFVGMIVGSVMSLSEDKTMSNIGTAATILSGYKLFSDVKSVARNVLDEVNEYSHTDDVMPKEAYLSKEDVSDNDKIGTKGHREFDAPSMKAM